MRAALVAVSPAGRGLLSEYPPCPPALVLSEAPHAELPEHGLTFVPLYPAGTLFGRGIHRRLRGYLLR